MGVINWNKVKEAIIKNISYDGEAPVLCPHCSGELEPRRTWLDHRGILQHKIVQAIGIDVTDQVCYVLDNTWVNGDTEEDADYIIKLLKNELTIGGTDE